LFATKQIAAFDPCLRCNLGNKDRYFSLVIIEALLIICSQLADALADSLCERNSFLQYTQALSLSRTSFSSSAGMFQLFAMLYLDAFTHNANLTGKLGAQRVIYPCADFC